MHKPNVSQHARAVGRAGSVGIPAVVISSIVFMLTPTVWWMVAGGRLAPWMGALLMIVLQYAAFTPMHESTHGNIGGSHTWRWLDIVCGWGCAAILLVPMPLFRAGHLQHHGHVNRPDSDPDHWVSRDKVLSILAACFTFVPRYYWNFARGTVPSRNQPGERRQVAGGFVGMGLFVAAMTYAGYGWLLLWLWLGPGLVTGGILALLFAWLPHTPHNDTGRWTNATIVPWSILTIPLMSHNFHLIHHLWPRIPFHRYPAVFAHERASLREHGARIVEGPASASNGQP